MARQPKTTIADPAADYVREWLNDVDGAMVCNAQFPITGMAFIRRAELWTFTADGSPRQVIVMIGRGKGGESDRVMQIFADISSNLNSADRAILQAMTEAAAKAAEI